MLNIFFLISYQNTTLEYSPAMKSATDLDDPISSLALDSILSKQNVLVLKSIEFKQIYQAFLNLNT